MRKLITGIIIIAIIILGLPFAAGFITQHKFMKFVTEVSKAPNINLVVKNYHRGWFQSTADVEITFSSYKLTKHHLAPFVFTLHEIIQHGPLLMTHHKAKFGYALAHSQLELSDKLKANLTDIIPVGQALPKIYSEIFFPFMGGADVVTSLPSFILEKLKQGKFSWKGAVMHANFNRFYDKVTGDLIINGFLFTTPSVNVQQDGINISYRMNQVEGLWVGRTDLDFPKIQVLNDGKLAFLLAGLKGYSESDLTANLVKILMQLNIDKWQNDDQIYGPGNLAFTFSKLNAIALMKMKQQLDALNDPNINDEQRQLIVMAAIPLLPSLLDRGARFDLNNFVLQTPTGKLSANGYIAVTPAPAGTKGSPQGVLNILQSLYGEATLEAPKQLVEQWLTRSEVSQLEQNQIVQELVAKQAVKSGTTQSTAATPSKKLTTQEIQTLATTEAQKQLTQWIKNGYLIEDGSLYKLKATLENKELKINGKLMH